MARLIPIFLCNTQDVLNDADILLKQLSLHNKTEPQFKKYARILQRHIIIIHYFAQQQCATYCETSIPSDANSCQ